MSFIHQLSPRTYYGTELGRGVKKKTETREPTGFQRDEPSTLAVVGEGDGGSGTREGKGKGREERGTYLGRGAVVAVASAFRRGRGGVVCHRGVGFSS